MYAKLIPCIVAILTGCMRAHHTASDSDRPDKGIVAGSSYTTLPYIHATVDKALLPPALLEPSYEFEATNTSVELLELYKPVLLTAFAKYPPRLLHENLEHVFLVDNLSLFGLSPAGTYSGKVILIAVSKAADSGGLERVFHAEFSSILLHNYSLAFDNSAWRMTLPDRFSYSGNAWKVLREGSATPLPDLRSIEMGFYNSYSMVSKEEDFNAIAGQLLVGNARFWRLCEMSPQLRQKMNCVVEFYHKIDTFFTEAYFRSLRPAHVIMNQSELVELPGGPIPVFAPKEAVLNFGSVQLGPAPPEMLPVASDAVLDAMQCYPLRVLLCHVESVYLVNWVEVAGTRGYFWIRDGRMIIPTGATGWAIAKFSVARAFHDAMARNLLHSYFPAIRTDTWQAINGAPYIGAEEAIRDRRSAFVMKRDLLSNGFINGWAQVSVESDMASIIVELMMNRDRFWKAVESYDKIRKKVDLALEFLRAVDESFTEEYCRTLIPLDQF